MISRVVEAILKLKVGVKSLVSDADLMLYQRITWLAGEANLEVNSSFKMIPCDAILESNFAVEPEEQELAGKWE